MSAALRVLLGGMFCIVSYCAAAALPRDDVMSAAYRCSSIADTRIWLDCYYGAAQPVRGVLGMPAVTEKQSRLAASPPTGGALQDVAAREEVMAAAARCYVLSEEKSWLDCYYGSAESWRSMLGLAPFQHSPARNASAPPSRSDTSMDEEPFLRLSRTSDPVVSRMASYSFDWNKFFTVTLDNGQIWRQREGDTTYAHWKDRPGAYLVTITKGALGSFNMAVRGGPWTFKVERIK